MSPVQAVWDPIWENVLAGNFTVFSALANLASIVAGIFVAAWALTTFRALVQGDEFRGWSSVIYPLLILVFLANGGAVLKNFILLQRAIIENVNQEIIASLNVSYDFQAGIQNEQYVPTGGGSALFNVVDVSQSQENVVNLLRNLRAEIDNCGRILGASKKACYRSIFDPQGNFHPQSQNVQSLAMIPNHYGIYINEYFRLKKGVDNILAKIEAAEQAGQSGGTSDNPDVAEGNIQLGSLSNVSSTLDSMATQSTSTGNPIMDAFMSIFEELLKIVQMAFAHFAELALLLTALLAPLAMAQSMLDPQGGLKPFVSWLVGFWSVGIARISMTVCQGVGQLITATDTRTFFDGMAYMAIGLLVSILAPVLAFALASGAGFAVNATLTQAAGSLIMYLRRGR